VKAGLEVSDGVLHLGAVVTNGVSDWSLAPVPEWAGQLVTIRASRGGAGDAVTLRARTATSGWRTLRVAPFTAGAASAGPHGVRARCAADLEVRFTRWALTPPDADLHEDPPESTDRGPSHVAPSRRDVVAGRNTSPGSSRP
jgi:regulation of enolase protein 1 (concanavalin A-like superfamily)